MMKPPWINLHLQRWVISVLLAGALVLAFIAWRYDAMRHAPPPAHFALVIDASDSTKSMCSVTAVAVQRVMNAKGVKRGSTLTIIRTGDASTRLEPQVVFEQLVPVSDAGPFGGKNKAKKEETTFIEQAQRACAGIKQTTTSPILKAVRRALVHLKSQGCPREAGCVLIVESDLQDNDELTKVAGKPSSIARVDNTGINILICGFAETVDDGTNVDINAVLTTWQVLFAEPATLTPFCGDGLP